MDYVVPTAMDKRPKLRIYNWNVGGAIYQKKTELENFLEKHNVDVMFLQETLPRDHWRLKFPGYQAYKNRWNDTCRDTAILIKDGISHYEYPLFVTNITATAVIIKTRGTEIGVVSAYDSPDQQIRNKFFKDVYEKLFRIADTVIVAGDFNSLHTFWGSRYNNARGIKLLKYTIDRDLSIHAPDDITHIPSDPKKKENILDFGISKNLNSTVNVFILHLAYN